MQLQNKPPTHPLQTLCILTISIIDILELTLSEPGPYSLAVNKYKKNNLWEIENLFCFTQGL